MSSEFRGLWLTRLSGQMVQGKVNVVRVTNSYTECKKSRCYWQLLISSEGHTPVLGKGRDDLYRSIVQKNIWPSEVGCHCEQKWKTIQILSIYEEIIASGCAGRNHREKLYSKKSNWGNLPAVQDADTNRRLVSVQYMSLVSSFVLKVHRTLKQSQI